MFFSLLLFFLVLFVNERIPNACILYCAGAEEESRRSEQEKLVLQRDLATAVRERDDLLRQGEFPCRITNTLPHPAPGINTSIRHEPLEKWKICYSSSCS